MALRAAAAGRRQANRQTAAVDVSLHDAIMRRRCRRGYWYP